MNEQEAQAILDQLANREIKEYRVTKEHFMEFRQQLVKRQILNISVVMLGIMGKLFIRI